MTRHSGLVLAAALLAWGCTRGTESKEAIRQGIVEYLSTRSNLSTSAMQIDVVSVNFRQNEADATVSFRPKGGGQSMEMSYTLERKGSRWVVKPRPKTGSTPHEGGMQQMMPPAPAETPGGAGAPSGHPQMGKGAPSSSKK